MNGLRYIRIRCNFSIGELAKIIGASRQAVSAWELNVKPIPKNRICQLADFFCVDQKFIGEINNDDLVELNQKSLTKVIDSNNIERFKYSNELSSETNGLDREKTLTESYLEKVKEKKQFLSKLDFEINGSTTDTLMSQMLNISRGLNHFNLVYQNYRRKNMQKSNHKQAYYTFLNEIQIAILLINKQIKIEDISVEKYDIDFINNLSSYFKKTLIDRYLEIDDTVGDFENE